MNSESKSCYLIFKILNKIKNACLLFTKDTLTNIDKKSNDNYNKTLTQIIMNQCSRCN